MGALSEIQAWFDSGKDYNSGVLLFEKYGFKGHMNLLRIFRKGPTGNYTVPKLDRELWDVLRASPRPSPKERVSERLSIAKKGSSAVSRQPEIVKPERANAAEIQVTRTKGAYSLENAPSVIRDKDREWRKLYKECGALREQIRNSEDEFHNHQKAVKILEREKRVRELQTIVDLWRSTGIYPKDTPTLAAAPAPTKINTADLVAVMKGIANLRSNITKAKKRGNQEKEKLLRDELNYLLTFVK